MQKCTGLQWILPTEILILLGFLWFYPIQCVTQKTIFRFRYCLLAFELEIDKNNLIIEKF